MSSPNDSTYMDVDIYPSTPPPTPPISRLPPELISTIFQHTLPTGHDIDGFPLLPEPHYSQPPLLLGRVSRSWRLVSHSTPGLWAGISLVDRAPVRAAGLMLSDAKGAGKKTLGGDRFAITVDLVRDWLSRSQSSLISVNFVGGYTDWRERSRFPVHSILLELTMHATRWAHVSFSLGVTDISLLSTLAQNHIPLPHLQTLRFTATTSPPPGFDVSRLDKDKAPKLVECIVNVAGLRVQFGAPNSTRIETGMSRLQVLELHEARSVFELLDVLDHCPLLVKLNITVSLPSNAPSSSSTHTTDLRTRNMPHLRVLDLWLSCERSSTSTSLSTSSTSDTTTQPISISLWHILHLPALQKLRVVASHPLRFELAHILVCLANSGTRLKELYLRGLRMNLDEMLAILQTSPDLQRLMVQTADQSVINDLLRALTIPVHGANPPSPSPSPSPTLCPHLQALSLPKYASADYEVLTRMLLSRCMSTIASLQLQTTQNAAHANSSTIAASFSPLTDLYLPLTARSTGPGPGAGAAARVAAILASPALNEEEREVIRREVRFVFDMFEDLWNAPGSDVVSTPVLL